MTLIADTVADADVADADVADAALTEEQQSAVAWLASVMNAFNRVAITSGYAVRPDA